MMRKIVNWYRWYRYIRKSHMQRRYDQLMYLIRITDDKTKYWIMVCEFVDNFKNEFFIDTFKYNLLKQIEYGTDNGRNAST